MSVKKFACIILAVLNLICVSALIVSAEPEGETVPTQAVTEVPTQGADNTGVPASSSQVADPSAPTGTVDPSSVTAPSGSGPSEPVTTVPVTRPTEIASDPGYTSNYVAQDPPYDPGDHNTDKVEFEEQDAEQILSANDKGVSGADDFGFIQENDSKGDEKDPRLFIFALACWFIALALVTLAILYRPRKSVAKASDTQGDGKEKSSSKRNSSKRPVRSAKKRKQPQRRPRIKLSEDEYNDDF